jgi:hypothetical protein
VDWNDSETRKYADKDYLGIEGKILEVAGLDAIVKLGSAGATGSLSITLDDTDSSIKTLLNTNDIHKRPARVYQIYEGLVETDKFLLFSGEVSSPITWDEGSRQVSFDIVSTIEDKQIGFSPEEGEFDFIADSAIGVPWPLAFGSVIRVPATRITEGVRGTSLTRYGQITIPELEQLCSLAVAAQQAASAKGLADNFPGFSLTNYATVVDNVNGTTIALNEFLDGLIFDSPTQEDDLISFVEICKSIERERIFFQQQYALYQDAEQRRVPLETTPGKPAVTGFNFFGATLNSNANTFVGAVSSGFNFGESERQGYRVGVTIPSYSVTFREAIPAIVGAVDQAQLALDQYIADNWPYTTPEQWAEDEALRDVLSNLQAQLTDAQGDSSTAFAFMTLANANIAIFNTQKLALERDLLQIVLTEIIVEGGEKFPQGIETEIIVNGMHFKGTFSGRTFTIDAANTPADVNVEVTPVSGRVNQFKLDDPTLEMKGKYCYINNSITFVENQDGDICSVSPLLFTVTGEITDGVNSHDIYTEWPITGVISKTSVFLALDWLDNIRGTSLEDFGSGLSLIRHRDYAIDIGDAVYIAGDYKEVYIANLIPSTVIHEVMAYRTIDGVRKLLPVPSRYYEVNLSEAIAGQTSTTLRFKRPLTEFFGENWEDQIYVSLTSSVGPNTVDIIEHLVDNYTDLTKDTTSFTAVRSSIDPFPSSFAYLDRRGAFTAIEEVAWQARCAAYIKDGTIFLKYLALEDAAIETVDESVVTRQTLQITMTPTEDLVTELQAEWDSDYSAEKRNRVILRNNIGKYGLQEEEFDFYIYNIQELVIKSATFWIIRLSNTWKIAEFKAPLTMLRLETFDTVALDFQNDIIASASVKGEVESAVYNSDTHELDFKVRSSVRAGELASYPLTWPAGVAVDVEYPTENDLFAGGATS